MNNGKNKGRRLRLAIAQFASMLIQEAKDLTGASYPQLDALLGLPDGKSSSYSIFPITPKTRAPQAASIQDLENRVARLLKRPAHVVVVEDNSRLEVDHAFSNPELINLVVGRPTAGMNLRASNDTDLQLEYEDNWPTYHQLLDWSAPRGGTTLFELYRWQYGVFWDRGILPKAWTREALGIDANAEVESFLPGMVNVAKTMRLIHQCDVTPEILLDAVEKYVFQTMYAEEQLDVERPDWVVALAAALSAEDCSSLRKLAQVAT
jgi:hypothetical protein